MPLTTRTLRIAMAMNNIPMQDFQARLPDLIHHLGPGEEVTITENGQPLAQVKRVSRTSWPCKAGSAKDKILRIASDFDAPLEEFREYME